MADRIADDYQGIMNHLDFIILWQKSTCMNELVMLRAEPVQFVLYYVPLPSDAHTRDSA